MHPRLRIWGELSEFLLAATEAGARKMHRALRTKRQGFRTRRPGEDTPLWNALATQLELELRPKGSKARVARYLGVPRQRLTDFLRGRRRQPDAEMALQLLVWLAENRRGRDLSF